MNRNTVKAVISREIREYNVKFSVFNILLALLVSTEEHHVVCVSTCISGTGVCGLVCV